jgi:hypothetical protein
MYPGSKRMWVHLASVYVITLVALKVSLLCVSFADLGIIVLHHACSAERELTCYSLRRLCQQSDVGRCIPDATLVVPKRMWVHLASVYVITLVALELSLLCVSFTCSLNRMSASCCGAEIGVHLASVYVITLVAVTSCLNRLSASDVVLRRMWVHLASMYVIMQVALK